MRVVLAATQRKRSAKTPPSGRAQDDVDDVTGPSATPQSAVADITPQIAGESMIPQIAVEDITDPKRQLDWLEAAVPT